MRNRALTQRRGTRLAKKTSQTRLLAPARYREAILVISPTITPAVKAPATHNRVEVVDLLRLLAALAVVFFHYTFRGSAGDDGFTTLSLPALAPFTKYGFMGVQLFFVISGFVIAYSAENRGAIEFGIARIARIYPCFIICMTLTFLLTLALGAPNFQTGLTHWLANFVIAAPTLHRPFMDGVYWSLVYELTFYSWIFLLLTAGWFRKHIDTIVAGAGCTQLRTAFVRDQAHLPDRSERLLCRRHRHLRDVSRPSRCDDQTVAGAGLCHCRRPGAGLCARLSPRFPHNL
jgi:hypothetical protein